MLIVLTIVFLAASILLARDRWVTVLRLGVGGVIGMVLARTAVHRLVDEAPDLAAKPAGRSLIEIVLGDATPGLLRATGAVLLVGLVAVIVSLLMRGRRRQDLVLLVSVAVGVAVVVIAGLSIWSLLVAVVLADRGDPDRPVPRAPRRRPRLTVGQPMGCQHDRAVMLAPIGCGHTMRSTNSLVAGSLRISLRRPSGRCSSLMTDVAVLGRVALAMRGVAPPRQSSSTGAHAWAAAER